ncbi:hypothetical protein F5Y10DRAFT_270013 [Nemania abortiva]|nr:hypothetical protein F5Y10DRAFT_270013 [Nemania abortiva]
MKASVVAAAISAGFAAAELLPTPPNFPACGTTCVNGVLSQAADLGCSGGGSTSDAVDGVCLCKNINFSYGIIDCANAVCPDGVAQTVVQYGIDWCAAQGVIVSGLSATPDPSVVSSPTVTVSATAATGGGSSDSGTASATVSEIISTVTNSDGSVVTTTVGTTTLSNGAGESSGTGSGVAIPISTTEIVSTVTNSDGAVVTTTLSTSVIYSTSGAESSSATDSGSASGSESASESTQATETSQTTGGSTETDASTSAGATSTDNAATTTSSDSGARQTAAPGEFVVCCGVVRLSSANYLQLFAPADPCRPRLQQLWLFAIRVKACQIVLLRASITKAGKPAASNELVSTP